MTVTYAVDDGENLQDHASGAAAAAVDLAWARPGRAGEYVTYPTLSFEELIPHIDTVHECLQTGGWALFDADDWLLPRLIGYLQDTWGDVAATYEGGGYRRVGGVTYEGHPGGGEYYTNGGYHVVFAHKGPTDRKSSVSARQVASRPPRECREFVDWGTMKPVEPYRNWLTDILVDGETVIVPHAGTAPAAIALAESSLNVDVVCVWIINRRHVRHISAAVNSAVSIMSR